MTFRRDLLLALGEVFPTDLDLGTPTRGGGDLYALYCVLAAGRRVVYDPGTWLLHAHPAGWDSLRRTGVTWGLGFGAFLSKVLVERREVAALQEWWWLVREYVRAVLWTAPAPEPVIVRTRFDYLRGGLAGPSAWALARRGAPPVASLVEMPPGAHTAAVRLRAGPVRRRGGRPRRDGRRAQPLRRAGDGRGPGVPRRRRRRSAGTGTGASRGAGGRRAARGRRRIGACAHAGRGPDRTACGVPSRPARPSPCRRDRPDAGGCARVQRVDPARAVRAARGLRRAAFRYTRVRDLAARALAAGAVLGRAPEAEVWTDPPRRVADVLAAARLAGEESALVARRHPEAAGALAPDRAATRAPAALVRTGLGRRAVPAAAAVLEAARLRSAWLTLVDAAESGAYAQGWRAGGGAALERPVVTVDLAADTAIPAPAVAVPLLDVRIGDRCVALLRPSSACWHPDLAEQIVTRLSPADWRALTLARGSSEETPQDAPVEVAGADGQWAGLDAAIRRARAPIVACPLPGVRVDRSWPAAVQRAFAGARVAVAVGAGTPQGDLPAPVRTTARRLQRRRYDVMGPGAQYVAVAREAYERLGGFDPAMVALGPHAAVLDLVERALDGGWVVAHVDVPGMRPAGTARPARSALKWRATRARGRLMVVKARERGGLRGSLWVLGNLMLPQAATFAGGVRRRREPSLRHWMGTSAALTAGALEQALRAAARRWH